MDYMQGKGSPMEIPQPIFCPEDAGNSEYFSPIPWGLLVQGENDALPSLPRCFYFCTQGQSQAGADPGELMSCTSKFLSWNVSSVSLSPGLVVRKC